MSTLPLPTIDQARCTGCQKCIVICPVQALAQRNGKAYLYAPELCTYCTLCENTCPENAIALPFVIELAKPHPSSSKSKPKVN